LAPSERLLAELLPWRRCGILGLAGVTLACTELAPGTDQLRAEPEPLRSSAVTPRLDSKWGCLGDSAPAPSAVALRPTVGLSLGLRDPATQATPPGARVRACNRFDIDCANPVQQATQPSSDGLVHLTLPQGFAGFLEITSPAIIPALSFFNPPLQTDRQDEFIVVGLATAQGLAASGNVVIDPEMGLLGVRTMDCQGELSAGVEFSNNIGGVPFAFVDGLPVIGYSVSSAEGLGGFVNVQPGLVVLQGQEVSSGRVSGTTSMLVRKGWFAYGDLNPAPTIAQ
jgi:hypothetical protein